MVTEKPGTPDTDATDARTRIGMGTAAGIAAGIGAGIAIAWYGDRLLGTAKSILATRKAKRGATEDKHGAAFSPGETEAENLDQTRSAGPAGMRDPAFDDWSEVDEASDESFPASDPPSLSPPRR